MNPELVPAIENYDQIKKWSSTIFSCPAIHLLNEFLIRNQISFGLVVVKDAEDEPTNKEYEEIWNVCADWHKFIKYNLLEKINSPELQLHSNFVNLVNSGIIKFLIVHQQQKYHWDGTVKCLVNIKSPSGIKIFKFQEEICHIRFDREISGKNFLSTFKKVHEGQNFTIIFGRLRHQLIYKINQLIPSALNSVREHYSCEVKTQPKRRTFHEIEYLVKRIGNAAEFCISSGSFEEFTKLTKSELGYNELCDKLSTYFMQLTFLMEISRFFEIDQQQSEVNCKPFHETIKKKIFPKPAAADLQNNRRNIDQIDHKINTIKTSSLTKKISLANETVKFPFANIEVQVISHKLIQITGNLVKFSQIIYNDHRSGLKQNHVFATQRIFLDQDYYDHLGRELEITLIAPIIEIVGNRVISLEGKPGENNFDSFAEDGEIDGQDGENGLPGKAGGNGGHLYLICDEIINASGLTVNVRGGNGGDGQDGGDGCDGEKGSCAKARYLSKGENYLAGALGTSGGNGGDGGAGGYPGHGGSVEIIVLGKQDGSVKVFKEPGKHGRDGNGGVGGTGGKNGYGIKKTRGLFGSKVKYINERTFAPDGKPGRDGANSINREEPTPKKCKPDLKETVIKGLRKFYMSQSDNGDLSVTRQFLEKIDLKFGCPQLSVKSLAQELLQLELKSRNFHDFDLMIREHEVFQGRIHSHVSLIRLGELAVNEDIKQVIKLLYAQSISKVLVLKEHHDQGPCSTGAQVINLLGYFDIIKDTINRLKESSLEVNRREALKTYHDHLKAKCDDTKDFISRIVLPSIAQAKREIQEEINCCAGEVECYGRMVKEDLRSRCDAVVRGSSKIHLWNIIKTVFNVLEFGIGVAQWFNGSQFAWKALLGITGFQKWIGTDESDSETPENLVQQPKIQLPDCLNYFHGTMEHKMRRMWKECELVKRFLEALDKHGSNRVFIKTIRLSLETWQDQMARFQRLLNQIRTKKSSPSEKFEKLVSEMEKSKTEVLICLQDILEMKLQNDINLSTELIDSINELLVDMTVENCDSTEEISNINKPQSSINTELVTIATDQLQVIQEKYATIFEDIIPLVNSVFDAVAPSSKQVQENLAADKNGSSESREFDKWRIQTTLRKLKEDLTSFFNGLESKTSLMQAVQQMEEGLSVLIDLYDMIDNYEESKLFSSALAGINLNSNNEDSVEMQATVDKIGYLLKANTFILNYNQVVHAFKQWIFPFAKKCHIPSLYLETDLNVDPEKHLKKLAAEYKLHFDTIHGHLLRYRSMKMDFDDVIFRGMFSSNSSACPPFYVWTWEEWRNAITRLLSGEEVELRSDLMNAEQFIQRKMGAVKFKTVQLKIRPNDGLLTRNLEAELDKIMKLFKVTLVHSGISYYKVFDQCFVMRGSRNEYCYSFDGATKNSTYEKSESQGDYLLSPFTIWRFRLNEILKGAGGFKKLKKFKEQVDLELWGEGLYLDEEKAKEKQLDEKYLKDLHLHYELVEQ